MWGTLQKHYMDTSWHQKEWLDDDGTKDIFVEVIANIKDASTLEFLTCINIGNKLGVFLTNILSQNIS